MSPREIYAALFNARGPVGAPSGEWRFVGDTACFEAAKFDQFVAESIGTSRAYVAVSRRIADEVEVDSLASLVPDYLKQGTVRIADLGLKRFVEINPVGVTRAWSHDA
jgi:hypothetical protein